MSKSDKTLIQLSIGKLAAQAGVGVETIRYYQRQGLLDEPQKPAGSQRRYSVSDLDQLLFILRAKAAGFKLREISALQSLGDDHCASTQSLAEEKLKNIEQQMFDLQMVHQRLQELINECSESEQGECCGLFKSLLDGDKNNSRENSKINATTDPD